MAGWSQLFSFLKSVRSESTSALDKFNATQKHLLRAAKGDPDPDELRDALIGSPLKKEIQSLKKLLKKLNKVVAPKVKIDEDLPKLSAQKALRQISKKSYPDEALYEAERIYEQSEDAIKLLLERHAEIIVFLLQMGRAEPIAVKVQANTQTLTGVMQKFLRVPVASSVVGPVWFDLEMSINPTISGIAAAYGRINQNYGKIDDDILKKAKEYQKLSKSLKKVIKDIGKDVYK